MITSEKVATGLEVIGFMGIICKEKVGVGGGDNWDIKIFNVTNCGPRRRESTLMEGGLNFLER